MKIPICGLCILLFFSSYAQKDPTIKNRNIGWITPVARNTSINGLAIGLMAIPMRQASELRINGVNIELIPVSIFTLPGSMLGTMLGVVPGMDGVNEVDAPIRTTIKGLNLSGGTFEGVAMRGVSLNLCNSYSTEMRGFETSLFMNSHYRFTGCTLSFWGNRSVEGRGVQAGLFNSCEEGRVFQIGMFNRIGRRVLPLINFSLGKRKRKPK